MKGKRLIRSLNRRGARSAKKPPVAIKLTPRTQPTVCESCGAVFTRRTWRRDHTVTAALLTDHRESDLLVEDPANGILHGDVGPGHQVARALDAHDRAIDATARYVDRPFDRADTGARLGSDLGHDLVGPQSGFVQALLPLGPSTTNRRYGRSGSRGENRALVTSPRSSRSLCPRNSPRTFATCDIA